MQHSFELETLDDDDLRLKGLYVTDGESQVHVMNNDVTDVTARANQCM